MKKSRRISDADVKKLYSRSAGRCNICKIDVAEVMEMAHIIAHSPNGARGNSEQVGDNSYDNLILLCSNCHTLVDREPHNYPVVYLQKIKREQEYSISSRLSPNQNRRENDVRVIQQLIDNYNFCNIPHFAELLPISVNLKIIDFLDLIGFLENRPDLYPLSDQELQKYLDDFIISFNNLWCWISGSTPINEYYCWQHFGQAEGNPPIIRRIYEKLSLERDEEIDRNIIINVNKVLCTHREMIQYVRENYPEINF